MNFKSVWFVWEYIIIFDIVVFFVCSIELEKVFMDIVYIYLGKNFYIYNNYV